jgi:shikimate dehydrogenase
MTKKVAVIGYPVKQSLSPVLHGYWIKKYNIDAEYGLLEVKPDDLEKTLLGLKDNGYVGCNLTIPHKEVAYNILESFATNEASTRATRAVNTVAFYESLQISIMNTDIFGFIDNIKTSAPTFDFTKGKAVVLGAGGAARAVVFGLILQKVPEIIITNRTKDRAYSILDDFNIFSSSNTKLEVADWQNRNEILQDANLLVNTTSLGMQGQEELDIDLKNLPKTALVTDIVYKPLQTKLLKNASDRGNLVVDGLGMLLYQAQLGFKMWFEIQPEVTKELREHVLSHIK